MCTQPENHNLLRFHLRPVVVMCVHLAPMGNSPHQSPSKPVFTWITCFPWKKSNHHKPCARNRPNLLLRPQLLEQIRAFKPQSVSLLWALYSAEGVLGYDFFMMVGRPCRKGLLAGNLRTKWPTRKARFKQYFSWCYHFLSATTRPWRHWFVTHEEVPLYFIMSCSLYSDNMLSSVSKSVTL